MSHREEIQELQRVIDEVSIARAETEARLRETCEVLDQIASAAHSYLFSLDNPPPECSPFTPENLRRDLRVKTQNALRYLGALEQEDIYP